MISSHELQQAYRNGRNCGHKKSPSRMLVELVCVKRHGGKSATERVSEGRSGAISCRPFASYSRIRSRLVSFAELR
jgi:hypothetical protein